MTIPPYYKGVLSNLKVHYTSGKSAPHKAILLLAISDLIESGAITKNEIGMTEELKEAFEERWDKHVPKDSQYKSAVWTPYWHMGYEAFWHFIPLEGVSDETLTTLAAGHTASIGKMKNHIKYSKLDEDLFELFLKKESRQKIRELLINTWLD